MRAGSTRRVQAVRGAPRPFEAHPSAALLGQTDVHTVSSNPSPQAPATYPANYVHETKKLIAARMGVGTKRVTELMKREDAPPVKWCRSKEKWVCQEEELQQWERGQNIPAREAVEKGLVRKSGRRAPRLAPVARAA
jgi:hypothetical protein